MQHTQIRHAYPDHRERLEFLADRPALPTMSRTHYKLTTSIAVFVDASVCSWLHMDDAGPMLLTERQAQTGGIMSLILIVVVLVLLFGGGGFYGHRQGYYGGGGLGGILGLLVVILVLLFVFGGLGSHTAVNP
jgi:hypothetical protein